MNNIDKPKRPLTRLITEGTSGTCPICKSTEIKRFIFFGRSIGCIQPECENYYKRCKNRKSKMEEIFENTPMNIGSF
jgi:hypothetical protein